MIDCQQQSLNNNWTLDRINSCHVGNLNDEFSYIQKDLREFKIETNQNFTEINHHMESMALSQSMIFYIVAGFCSIILIYAFKKMVKTALNGKK